MGSGLQGFTKLLFSSVIYLFFTNRRISAFRYHLYNNYDPGGLAILKLSDDVFSAVGRDPLIAQFHWPARAGL
uniref:Uncharacterized protein n=1 Tax=Oryza brachyantha TaxID=4533 RepID=J3M1X0_ORYBR